VTSLEIKATDWDEGPVCNGFVDKKVKGEKSRGDRRKLNKNNGGGEGKDQYSKKRKHQTRFRQEREGKLRNKVGPQSHDQKEGRAGVHSQKLRLVFWVPPRKF